MLGFSANATGKLEARGRKGNVRYDGELSLSGGELYLLSTGQELKDVSAHLIGNGTWIKLDSLHASSDKGTLQASGGIGFDDWVPRRVQAALILDSFPVEREGAKLATLTGSAALTTEIGDEKAMTAMKIHELSIELPNATTR